MILNLPRESLRDLFPVVDGKDPVRYPHDHVHVVFDQQDGQMSLFPKPDDQLFELPCFLGIHPRRRLIEQQDLRIAGQRPGDFQPPLCAVGQISGQFIDVCGKPDVFEDTITVFHNIFFLVAGAFRTEYCSGNSGMCAAVAADHDIFQNGHTPEKADILEGAPDAEGGDPIWREARGVRLVQQYLPRIGYVDAGEEVEQRCLARAVRSDDRLDLSRRDFERDAVDCDEAAEAVADVVDFKQRHGAASPRARCLVAPHRAGRRWVDGMRRRGAGPGGPAV